jgi:hypothetical protein
MRTRRRRTVERSIVQSRRAQERLAEKTTAPIVAPPAKIEEPTSSQTVESHAERRIALYVLGGALALGAALRVWLSLNDDGIYWPDEIYQSLEPAHRLVFGYGLLAWEFIDGARNWTFPALVAAVFEVARFIGLDDPRDYLGLTRLTFSAIGVATAFGAYCLARAYGAATLTAACGAAAFALAALMIYLAPRALSETASALPVVLGFSFALWPGAGRRKRVLGASLLGGAVLLRLHDAVFCAGLLGIFAGRRQFRAAIEAGAVFAVWALLYGLIDRVTWGGWFHSVFTYVSANLSPEWYQWWATHPVGLEPPEYYARVLWTSAPVLTVLVGGLSLAAVRRAPGLLAVAIAFFLVHSAFPHKEFRYIVPVLPIFCALAAIGLEEVRSTALKLTTQAASDLSWASPTLAIAILASSLFSAAGFHDLTFRDVGQSGPRDPSSSAYDSFGQVNRLLLVAHDQPDLCGLKVEVSGLDITGGYSYLHRPVPLYSASGPARESGYFNYIITWLAAGLPGQVQAFDHGVALVRLRERCVADTRYDWLLR